MARVSLSVLFSSHDLSLQQDGLDFLTALQRVRERRGACASSAKLGACEATGVASVLSTGGELPADPEPEQRAEGF